MPLTRHLIAVAATAVVLVGAPAGSAAASGEQNHDLPRYSDGHPRDARITMPTAHVHRLRVVAYRGKTDDGPGTVIQNRGIAAAPYGPQGGTGVGGIGNYQVTAHRTSHGGIFRQTPSMHRGDKVIVDSGPWRWIYRVTGTRWVSFRSQKSLHRQRAAVPGHPRKEPRKGYITISTCATPEDHARGNYWTDRFGNPEHRIDKIGVLVRRVHNPYWHKLHPHGQ
ncbi:sortase [Nocardioides sp. CN2-186]|uniref:sortase domain-containing protein n=1 Tax=Nocardioides tweenelious TaxID=3156607 RepID=UPI0032B528F6